MAKKSVSVLTANNYSVNVTGFATHKDLHWANRAAVYRIMISFTIRSSLRPQSVKSNGRIIRKKRQIPMAWKNDPSPKNILKEY